LFSDISLVGVPLGGISQRWACSPRHAAISSSASPGVRPPCFLKTNFTALSRPPQPQGWPPARLC